MTEQEWQEREFHQQRRRGCWPKAAIAVALLVALVVLWRVSGRAVTSR